MVQIVGKEVATTVHDLLFTIRAYFARPPRRRRATSSSASRGLDAQKLAA
ncbi:hypothetical protein MY4824_009705 [Beauveria thailandica]